MAKLEFEVIPGGVLEQVDKTDLKSVGESRTGSSPVSATISFELIEPTPDSLPAPVWDTTKDEKDYCECGERSDILLRGVGYCDDHWYQWLCKDRGYDVRDRDEDERFVATIFI